MSGHVTQISTGFIRGCQILQGSDKFSQSYDHYKILCKLASGHALICLSLSEDPPATMKCDRHARYNKASA